MNEYKLAIDSIIERFVTSDDFWSCEVTIPESERTNWVCMRQNPKHFTQSMFIGSWSDSTKNPGPEVIRLVRAMDMPDDSLRIIGRQGDDLFVLTIPEVF